MPKRIKIIILFLVIVGLGYSLFHFVAASRGVPQEFSDARVRGALVAQAIVSTSNQITTDLNRVNELDGSSEFTAALTLTIALSKQSDEIRAKATELSQDVQQMTLGLSLVRSTEARQAALDAISSNLAMISNLINYSASMSDLLGALRDKFTGKWSVGSVKHYVDAINADVVAVNSFNQKAVAAMERFDSLTK